MENNRPNPEETTPNTYQVPPLPDTGHKAIGAVTKDGDLVLVIKKATAEDVIEYGVPALMHLAKRINFD